MLQYEPSSILLENSQDAHFEQTFFYFFILNIYKSYFYSCLQPVVGLLFQAMVFGMLYLQKQLLIVVAGCLLMLQLHKLLKYATTKMEPFFSKNDVQFYSLLITISTALTPMRYLDSIPPNLLLLVLLLSVPFSGSITS